GKPLYPLSSEDVLAHVLKGELVPPADSEISDRSKGSWVSKLLAVLQTAYFVLQCIARLVDHQAVTNIEVMALAYTIITIPMYCFWWNKPLNVKCPIRVPMNPTGDTPEITGPTSVWTWRNLISFVWMKHLAALFLGEYDSLVDLRKTRRVSTFYSGNPTKKTIFWGDLVMMSLAVVFGAVHGIAFLSPFITETEKVLWGICTVVVLGVPFMGLSALALYYRIETSHPILRRLLIIFVAIPSLGWYLLARGLLFVLALIELRSLPCSAFETVQWLGFIPHV
ncbi:hypothetical protein FIBSPDRAFT_723966, partial [Athelia psychrophila]